MRILFYLILEICSPEDATLQAALFGVPYFHMGTDHIIAFGTTRSGPFHFGYH
nr:MAG TPA: hypothetical protein [Caudoviricetes sp.]